MKSDLGDRIYLAILNQWSWWWEVSNTRDELARAILSVSIVALTFLWYKWLFPSRKHNPPLPPGPRGLPVVGYLPFLDPNLHHMFTNMAHRYGPIHKLWLGGKLHVVVNSSALAKAVVRDQDLVFANWDPPLAALILTYGGFDIAWSNNNEYWRTTRKIFVREVMSNANLEASQSFRRDEVKKTVKNVFAKIGTKIDINEIAFWTELNVVTSMLWGSTLVDGGKTGDREAEFRKAVFKIVELLALPNVSDFFPRLARFDLQGVQREAKKQLKSVDRIFDSIIEEKLKLPSVKMEEGVEKGGRKDFLQILLELRDSETSFSTTQIKAILMDILLGGTDTTATMAEWTIAELLKNPGEMKKVQNELTQVIGTNNTVEESHLPKLQYLDAVIKETFRLHTPLPLLTPRSPNQSCTVGGYTVPKGTIVFLNVWAIHRDPENWKNPLEFKPERFLNIDDTKKWDYNGNNFKFFPFGSGRRTCAGIPLAEKMLMYILASLLHSFEWNLPEGEELDLSDTFGLVLKKRTPLIAIPSQRLTDENLYFR